MTLPYLALWVVYLVWGTTMVATRVCVEVYPPAVFLFARFFVAGLILLLFCLFIRKEPFPRGLSLRRECIAGLLLMVCGNSLSAWALQYLPAGFSSLVLATVPLWMVTLNMWLPPKEPPVSKVWTGMAISCLGMALLFLPQLRHPLQVSPVFWWSLLILFINAFFWASGSVYVRKTASNASLPMGVAIQHLTAAAVMFPILFFTTSVSQVTHLWHTTSQQFPLLLGSLLYLVVFGTMVATPCYYYILKTMPVSFASSFAYVTPVITVLSSHFMLQEPITALSMVSAAIILAGVYWVQTVSAPPSQTKATLA